MSANELNDVYQYIKKSIKADNGKDDKKGFPVLVHFLSFPKEETSDENKPKTETCSRTAEYTKQKPEKIARISKRHVQKDLDRGKMNYELREG